MARLLVICAAAAVCSSYACAALVAPGRRAPRAPAAAAKKRDYGSGGLGTSNQEELARLWRARDAPEAGSPPPPPETLWEAEIAASEAADASVPDANWRQRTPDGRSVPAAAWAPLRDASGSAYGARDAWRAVEARGAAALVVVVGSDAAALDAAARALHDRLPARAGYVAVVAAGDAAGPAKRRAKRFGAKLASLYDPSSTFAAACGVSGDRVLVLAPPHPSPDAHTVVAKFACAEVDTIPRLIQDALFDKHILR